MTVKVLTVENNVECFEVSNYIVTRIKDMNPMILSVKIYSGTKVIMRKSRPFKWFYKHVTFKSRKVQAVVMEMQRKQAEAKAEKEDND